MMEFGCKKGSDYFNYFKKQYKINIVSMYIVCNIGSNACMHCTCAPFSTVISVLLLLCALTNLIWHKLTS